jgi:hypothetical protein
MIIRVHRKKRFGSPAVLFDPARHAAHLIDELPKNKYHPEKTFRA